MTFAEDRAVVANSVSAAYNTAAGFLNSLGALGSSQLSLNLPRTVNFGAVPSVSFPILSATRPDVSVAVGSVPTAPTLSFSTVSDVDVPTFDVASPVLDFPAVPDTGLPDTPGAAPAFVSPSLPAAPSLNLPATPVLNTLVFPDVPTYAVPDIPAVPLVNLPAVPTFETLALPEAPAVNLPAFTAGLPANDLTAPTAEFQFYEAAYSSTLLDPLKAKLLYDLTYGGYGIDINDEVALFNRARDREVEAMLSRIEDAGRAMASRGFPLPPGELSIHVDRAYQDMQDKVSSASRDITLERSKLYVDNRQFTLREVKDVEQVLIGFHNLVQERTLNAAKVTVEMSIALFKSLVERYNSWLEAYRVESTVFAERIRGELAKAEMYRTQIEAVGVQSQIQQRQVDVYRAQNEAAKIPIDIYRVQMDATKVRADVERTKIDAYRSEVEAVGVQSQIQQRLTETYLAQLKGIELSVDMYRTQMEAANIQAQIEKTRLEAYRYSIDAYTAQVQAKVAEFGMYRAQIDGETAKVSVFGEQVRAYGGQVSAAKIRSDVQVGRLQSETEQARVRLANYQGQIAQYEADIKRQLDSGRLEVDVYSADVASIRAQNEGALGQLSLQEKLVESTRQQNIEISKLEVLRSQVGVTALIEHFKALIAAAGYGSQAAATMAAGWASALSSLSVETTSS